MTWRIIFRPRARRELDALDRMTRERIERALVRLLLDPARASNVKALHGGGFRLRVGDWRVVYELQAEVLVVLVIRVAHRREAYRP